jgi:hypothetical protein
MLSFRNLQLCIMYTRLCPDGAEGSAYSMLTTFGTSAAILASSVGNAFAGIWWVLALFSQLLSRIWVLLYVWYDNIEDLIFHLALLLMYTMSFYFYPIRKQLYQGRIQWDATCGQCRRSLEALCTHLLLVPTTPLSPVATAQEPKRPGKLHQITEAIQSGWHHLSGGSCGVTNVFCISSGLGTSTSLLWELSSIRWNKVSFKTLIRWGKKQISICN